MTEKNIYKPSRRNWVKLWVDEWLGGTTRFELSEKQRAIWIDLLAMAGKSRFPGVVASGKYDDGYSGYPISYLACTLVYDKDTFTEALGVCEKYGKIKIEYRNHDGVDNVVIYINSWDQYQSEYQRQKKYGNKEEQEIFKFWNEQNIIVHEKITAEITSSIDKALKTYSIDEIKNAIQNYKEILSNQDKYYFSYTWSLQEFCSRKNAIVKFVNLDIARKNYLKKTNSQSKQPTILKREPPKTIQQVNAEELDGV